LQRGGQVVRVIRQRVQILVAQHERALVGLGLGAHAAALGDVDLLLFEFDAELDVQRLAAVGGDRDLRVLVGRETGRRGAHRVAAGRDAAEEVNALLVRRRRALGPALLGDERDGRADDDAAELVGDRAAERSGRLLLRRRGEGREREEERRSQTRADKLR
jgi:hypothetical protein